MATFQNLFILLEVCSQILATDKAMQLSNHHFKLFLFFRGLPFNCGPPPPPTPTITTIISSDANYLYICVICSQ